MHPIIENHLEEIIAICEEFGIARLELFGSAATGEFDPNRSDIDFLIEYPAAFDSGPWGSRKEDLRQRLSDVLGRKVDLVILKNVRNPYIASSIEGSRQLVYAA